jgi:hypothetical protein
VFRILKNPDPTIWLKNSQERQSKEGTSAVTPLAGKCPASHAFGVKGHNMIEITSPGSPALCVLTVGRSVELHNLSFEFWRRYRPPLNRKYKKGISGVDVTISYKDGIIFIEAEYLAPVNLRTTSGVRKCSRWARAERWSALNYT